MTPSAGTMPSLGELHGNAKSPVVGETPRPDVSGDRRFWLTSQSPFCVSDNNTQTQFLIDIGLEVSVIPPTPTDRRHQLDKLTLTAINNTPINTYRKWFLNLNLGLRCPLPLIFVITEVKKHIIGAGRHEKATID